MKLWNVRTGQEIRSLRHTGQVYSVTFSPNGEVVASTSAAGFVTLWDARTGQEIRDLRGKTDRGKTDWADVTFSPNGQLIATGGLEMTVERTVKLWNARTGQEIRVLRGHTGDVFSVTFSDDNQVVASGSRDKTVRLWDVGSGQEIRTLRGHADGVTSVAFSPDGQIIASGSGDKTVKLWDVRTRPDVHFLMTTTVPDPIEQRHLTLHADQNKQPFTAACRLGFAIAARLRLPVSPWDPVAAVHVVANGSTPLPSLASYAALEDGRCAQTAFVDGPTYAGILVKDSGRSAKGLVVRAQWAVDQWPEGWQNREVLGGALYRDGDYKGAVRELMESQKLRAMATRAASAAGGDESKNGQNRSSNPQPTVWSCHFLALAHHQLGDKDDAAAWRAKAVLPKDASWEDAMIDRYLRREVEAEFRQ